MRSNDAHIWTWTSAYIVNVVISSNPAVHYHPKMYVVTNSLNGATAVWESKSDILSSIQKGRL